VLLEALAKSISFSLSNNFPNALPVHFNKTPADNPERLYNASCQFPPIHKGKHKCVHHSNEPARKPKRSLEVLFIYRPRCSEYSTSSKAEKIDPKYQTIIRAFINMNSPSKSSRGNSLIQDTRLEFPGYPQHPKQIPRTLSALEIV
jgi:hypothetical protein